MAERCTGGPNGRPPYKWRCVLPVGHTGAHSKGGVSAARHKRAHAAGYAEAVADVVAWLWAKDPLGTAPPGHPRAVSPGFVQVFVRDVARALGDGEHVGAAKAKP